MQEQEGVDMEQNVYSGELHPGDRIIAWPNVVTSSINRPRWSRRRQNNAIWQHLTGVVLRVLPHDGAYATICFEDGKSDRAPLSQYALVERTQSSGVSICICGTSYAATVACLVHDTPNVSPFTQTPSMYAELAHGDLE